MKLKLVHFITDDKFLEYARLAFDAVGIVENLYVHISDDKNLRFRHLNNFNGPIIIISHQEIKQKIQEKHFCDAVILHDLYSAPLDVIRIIPKDVKVVWLSWGYDIYSNPYPGYPLVNIGERYFPYTKDLVRANVLWKKRLKNSIKYVLSLFYENYSRKCFKEAVARADYFAGVYQIEYDMLQESTPFFKAEKVVFNYSLFEEQIDVEYDEPQGNDIIVGNCASPLGNHIDILKVVYDRMGDKIDKIICPLSYGQKKYYVDAVIKEGQRLFGQRFVALTKFLPYADYQNVIKNCRGMILGFMQQGGVGNVTSGLNNGLNVYVPKKSMNYSFFSQLGTTIKTIEDDLSYDDLQKKITMADLMKNRQIIFNTFNSKETSLANVRSLIDKITKSLS